MSVSHLLDKARAVIDDALARHSRPAVMCSFGKDSMLLLQLVQEQCEPAVIWLGHDVTAEQFRFIDWIHGEWNLTLFKLAPTTQYVIQAPNGEYSLVREYVINGTAIPVLSDLVHSNKRCLLKADRIKSQNIGMPFDCIFTGWKDSDSHAVFGNGPIPFPADGTKLCSATWYAPLRSLTDEDVWKATRTLSIPHNKAKYDLGDETVDPDNTVACSKCLTKETGRVYCPDIGAKIKTADWDREWNRQYFLHKFFGL